MPTTRSKSTKEPANTGFEGPNLAYFCKVPSPSGSEAGDDLEEVDSSEDAQSNAMNLGDVVARSIDHTSTSTAGSQFGARVPGQQSQTASSQRDVRSGQAGSTDGHPEGTLRATRSTRKLPDIEPSVSTTATKSAGDSTTGGDQSVSRDTGKERSDVSDEWEPSETDLREIQVPWRRQKNPMREAKGGWRHAQEKRVLRSHTQSQAQGWA